jgi:hypothetical protein
MAEGRLEEAATGKREAAGGSLVSEASWRERSLGGLLASRGEESSGEELRVLVHGRKEKKGKDWRRSKRLGKRKRNVFHLRVALVGNIFYFVGVKQSKKKLVDGNTPSFIIRYR